METDEAGTLTALKAHRKEVLEPLVARHQGRIFKVVGDGVLVEFASAVNAVQCAVDLQQSMAAANAGQPADRHIVLRIGVNLGDVIVEGGDLYGDGVNVAARLEGVADPGGICLSRGAHDQVKRKLDVVFEDRGELQLKNIAEPVRVYRMRPITAAASITSHRTAPFRPLPEKPSIAVLPFQNMSGDPEQDYFCDGLVEDIITTLSKLTGLRVIARNSTFVFKGRSVDVREAAQRLGVRYVLEGSVRKSGNRIRITAQLIDAQDGTHLWAERYNRAMDDIFAIQDEITLVLATEMQVKLTEGEHARLHYTTTTNVEAWTCWIQGMSHHRQAVTKEAQGQARFFWEKALALDPASASLNAQLGLLHSFDARFGWWDDHETAIEKALAYVDKAFELDSGNAVAYTASSLTLLFQRQHDKAVAAARKAVELAPGAADTAELASHVLAASGYPQEAVVLSEKAMTLNPNYPANYLGTLGDAYRLSGRTEQAIEAFQAYHARNPGFGLTDIVIAYQQTGRSQEARRTAEQLLAARPNFTIAAWLKTQFSRRDTAQVEADAAALRAAGLPPG
ncbi:MAG TPA: adenylate/guanylate cyclase domain-containing protein [Pseudolabrys sp.]|nr:adenylate/guanylate cyclase domain-containing protein [Pseudolabrys sp.]